MDKGKIILRKFKTIGISVLLFFVGATVAVIGSPTPDGYTELLNEKNALTESIEEQGSELSNKEKEIADLLVLKDDLKLKEKEALAKKEEALAKAEEEKKAQEAEEKRKQEEAQKLQASQNKTPTNVTTNSGGSSNAGTSNKKPAAPSKPQDTTQSGGNTAVEPIGKMVWKTATGKKYHSINNCGKTNPAKATQVTLDAAKSAGLTPCSKCF